MATSSFSGSFGSSGPSNQPQFQQTPLGNQVGNDLYDPATGTFQRTGAQKGTNAGEALNALAKTTGLNLLGGSSGSAYGSGGAGAGYGTDIAMPSTTAGTSASFARAKDQVGQTSRASLTALQDEMGGNNMLGSGMAGGLTRDIIEHGAGQVNEVSRDQAVNDANAANSRAQQEYQGRITMRGQDINAAQQQAARNQQVTQGLLQMIGGSGILY